jgi:DNA-binding CsgD family transcriptional regulator
VIELFGWDDAEVGAALGGAPDADFVAAVARRSGGNPFFVAELARARTAGLRVPAAARDVVRARIRRLPEPCRALLGAAAVLGRDVDAALLAAVTGVDGVLDELRPALDDGVLDHPAGRVGLRFTHDLVRESVLADLAAAEQARVHLAVVAALAPSADDPDVVTELAHHALAALPAGDRRDATGWARKAAHVAHALLAYDETARLLADALAAGRPVLSPAERLAVLLDLARARGLAHDVAGGIATFTEAAELARATGDAEGLARAALGLPEVSNPEWLDAVRAWCEEALRGIGEGDTPLKAKVLAQLAHCALLLADARVMDEASAAALTMAERLDDPASLAIALRARQLARAAPDGNAERLVLGGRLLALGERTGDREDVLWGRMWRFDALLQAGRVSDAEAELAAVEPVVAALRRPLARLHLLRSRVAVTLGQGRFAEARAQNDEAMAIAERGGDVGAVATARSVRLGMVASTGDDPDPRDLDWVRSHPTRMHPMAALTRAQMARLFLDRGERSEAREWYASLPEPGSPRIPAFIALALEGMRALLLADLGDAATAEAVYRVLLPHADLHLVGGAGAITTGGSARGALGIAALTAGKPDIAVQHLRSAVTADDAAGLANPAALARVELAVALRARGRSSDVDESVGLLVEADAAAERMGMAPLRARIAALGAAEGGVLSRREAEIAELVGRGLTNRQIAASAHISERTVETHVGHVLAKLGFTRRSEIAAWVAGRKQ